MSTDTTGPEAAATVKFSIDTSAAPVLVGAQIADAMLPLAVKVAHEGLPIECRAEFWHGFMAAVSAAMGAQVGLVQSEAIMHACIGYGRRMAAEEAEAAKGAH